MLRSRIRSVSLGIISIFFFLNTCIDYHQFPEEFIHKAPEKTTGKSILYYKIENGTIFKGKNRLKEIFAKETPFSETISTANPPAKGLFVRVQIESVPPSIPAILFGYFSMATLTILPAWSREDGYDVEFQISKDGSPVKSYTYPIRRKVFAWILMLPVVWINASTYNEQEAFAAITNKFFADSKDFLK
ncbi:hypothetical protein LEP1GSC047_4020 [Leptospira inadai serovar Lyme str. 10]|uniref:Lipoprotein n=2 Tax=Leptospira inadai serovar Lyme TaxID=293084 RepID=V6HBW2_9LEPT|nr:hypothetical protein [Leptospira inadai]EQA37231.1 hypothetical protein LEP1GSC047_4020 [Leptospira inadai serovar Lyme str. 10]PNV71897.1 hypothetical protein BES34_020575 [Leptospira inadai serovar Lyme]